MMNFGSEHAGKEPGMSKEDLRIRLKREANEARRIRFLNARTRVIGLDVDALNAQVAAKNRMNAEEKDSGRNERMRMMEIDRVLEAAQEEEKMMREYQKQELKNSWELTIAAKKAIKDAPPAPFIPDNCGASAAQMFVGEDRNRVERTREQKNQMKRWVQEQVAEKSYLKSHEKDDDYQYADAVKVMDEVRLMAEKEEEEMRNYWKQTVKNDNLELARIQRARNTAKTMDGLLPGEGTSLILPDEDQANAMDENGRIIRRDAFKGFTEAQRRRIMQENAQVLTEQRQAKENENSDAGDWKMQAEALSRAMEQASAEEKAMRSYQTQQQLSSLKEQMAAQAKNRESEKRNRYGTIGNEFFSNFGTSCR